MSQSASIILGKPEGDVWVACGSCDRVSSHKVLTVISWRDESPDGEITVWKKFMTVMCQGCRTVSFCVASTCSEDLDYDPKTGEQCLAIRYELYPSRVAGRPEMESIHDLPFGISSVYRETRSALCSDQSILAGIGIRAIVEAVCKDRGATGHNLEKRIDDLVTKKIVTEDGAKILHSLRFMGNDAAHEVKAHTI